MLWLKAFHVIAMVTWFAGLFYLPRLFVYHADATDPIGVERFKIMERRLFVIMTIGAVATVVFGVAMVMIAPAYLTMGWLHAKLLLVAVADSLPSILLQVQMAISPATATPARPSGTAASMKCPRCC